MFLRLKNSRKCLEFRLHCVPGTPERIFSSGKGLLENFNETFVCVSADTSLLYTACDWEKGKRNP